MALSEEDRAAIDRLAESNTRLAQETAVSNTQLAEIRNILFGEKADGFLYEFAAMRKDIQSIPELAALVHDMVKKIDLLGPLAKRVRAIDRYITRQRIKTAVLAMVLGGLMSFVAFVISVWSGLGDIVNTLKVHK